MNEIKQELLAILQLVCQQKEDLMIDFGQLEDSVNLRNELGLDSLELAELTVRLEDRFGVDIYADGLVNTLGEVLEKLRP